MGYTDIHCHGGGGHTFGDSVEGTLAAVEAHRAHGTAKVVCSLVSAPFEVLAAQVRVIQQAMTIDSSILGIHLEGPFLAPERKGAHDPSALALPTAARIDELLTVAHGALKQITMAPELPGAIEAIRTLADAGVVVALGHTEADSDQVRAGFDAGAALVTHAFNAMRPIEGREPGVVGVALARPDVFIEVIADGHHVASESLAMLFAAAPDRIVLVTDAMAAAAAPEGSYELGGLAVDVEGGKAVIAGTLTLAGSTLTLDRALEVCAAAGVPQASALAAASTNPERLLRGR